MAVGKPPPERRCTGKSKTTGKRCTKWSRKGGKVCGTHGAGYAKREKAGAKKDPATVNITHGQTAKQATIARYATMHPGYRELVESYASDKDKLHDLDSLLARTWAMIDVLSQSAPQWHTDPMTGQTFAPPLVQALTKLCQILESVARQEGRLKGDGVTINNMISIRSTQEFTRVVLRVLDDYIPDPAVRADAVRKIEEGLRAMLPQEAIEVRAS